MENGTVDTRPKPTITVRLVPQPAPEGGYYFEAGVAITEMPGGWATAHHGLCLALEEVAKRMVADAHEATRVVLAHTIPGG